MWSSSDRFSRGQVFSRCRNSFIETVGLSPEDQCYSRSSAKHWIALEGTVRAARSPCSASSGESLPSRYSSPTAAASVQILGERLQRLRKRRRHLLAAANQRTARWTTRRKKSCFRKSGSRDGQGDRHFVKHVCLETVRRPGIAYGTEWSERCRSRSLPRIWRDAQRRALGGPLDQLAR